MMKRVLLYALLPVIVLLSCSKEKNVFNKTPDQRITDTLTAYQARLTGSPYGWVGLIYPKSGGVYSFYFSFDGSGRVKMVSDFDSTSSSVLNESSYRLEALQQPSLIFDTYNYIHLLADPNGNINGGPDGEGLQSDFEFAISDSSTADTIRLTGRFNGSRGILWKASQAERDGYYNQLGLVRTAFDKVSFYYFKSLTTATATYDIYIGQDPRTITFQWKDGSGNIHSFTTTFYYTPDGIVLGTPFTNGSLNIQTLTNVTWNASTSAINATANGSAVTIKGSNTPVAIDLGAASAWYQAGISAATYWYSFQGFHVKGVDDAYRVDTLTTLDANNKVAPYYYLIYWPGYDTGNDLFAPIFVSDNSLILGYGWAPTFSAKTDGHGVFTILGTYGTTPVNGGGYLSALQLNNTNGFYFVKTGPTAYDMISKADSRIWISWNLAQ